MHHRWYAGQRITSDMRGPTFRNQLDLCENPPIYGNLMPHSLLVFDRTAWSHSKKLSPFSPLPLYRSSPHTLNLSHAGLSLYALYPNLTT